VSVTPEQEAVLDLDRRLRVLENWQEVMTAHLRELREAREHEQVQINILTSLVEDLNSTVEAYLKALA